MSILTGPEIKKQMKRGNICITPFDERYLGPNSYDVRLAPRLRIYRAHLLGEPLDMREAHETVALDIPADGVVMQPGVLYLASTVETAVSCAYVPRLEGRSSIGRLGISCHVTAGFGDVGWGYEPWVEEGLKCTFPTWTLEMWVVHPVRVYAGVKIAQVYFETPKGKLQLYKGKYNHQKEPEPSRLSEDAPPRPCCVPVPCTSHPL